MKKIISILISLLFVGSTFGVASILGTTGGPDVFGYTYDDTVPYQWIDISTTGTDAGLNCDDCGTIVPIGFDFKFYGNTYNQVSIVSNGYLQFGDTSTTFSNSDIPSTNDPENISCVFWDDLDPRSEYTPGKIYYQAFPNKFIVQWDKIAHFSDKSARMTFQVILYRNSNAIKFQYKEMKNGAGKYADGRSATVGIENSDGTDGLKYYFGNTTNDPAGPIKNGLAIGFRYPGTNPSWYEVKQLPMEQILKIVKGNQDKE
ncbi:MAG TPA: hypothetical protein PKH80_08150 [Methanofastidiosum sp.]|nr:hypothetical protein [Methanofastidiosum sp.]HNU61398.1 hypothetical protein [Methanofastidiosum sp.]